MEHLAEFIVNHWILVTLFVLLSALLLSDSINQAISGSKPVGTAQAVNLVNQQRAQFIDVRDQAEFNHEHISDSINMPVATLADKVTTIKDKTQPVILVCSSGQRAKSAAKQFKKHDFAEVYVLNGGLTSWKEAKLPLFN